MIEGQNALIQTLLGTLLTWGFTAAGAGLVFVFRSGQRKVLDGSLGFAAGVMMAASFWSLLEPALELATHSGRYGSDGQWAFVPVAIGFLLGAIFVLAADRLLPHMDAPTALLSQTNPEKGRESECDSAGTTNGYSAVFDVDVVSDLPSAGSVRKRTNVRPVSGDDNGPLKSAIDRNANHSVEGTASAASWKRILLLIIAITIHNIPEGLAVGVGFGAIGKTASSTFQSARNLALGIGIQNFPEGLSVSLPLRGAGFSVWKSFWYGQLSGMVEPVAGLLGAVAVTAAEPLLPYALAFAAGAMVYVVVDDIIPEAQMCGNGRLASCCCIVGFLVMMSLDVGLG